MSAPAAAWLTTASECAALFGRSALEVAPDLVGSLLRRDSADGPVTLRITEVEAYDGARDPGAHSFRGRTARNSTLFADAGHVYVYFTYGMHHAINLVCDRAGEGSGVLIRAGEIVEGRELARARRTAKPRKSVLLDRDLARGPGNVAQALGADLAMNGEHLIGGAWSLAPRRGPMALRRGPRVGVSGPGGSPDGFAWRFWAADDATVSAYTPARDWQHLRGQRAVLDQPFTPGA